MSTHNFNAGPAVLPRPALEQAQAELLDFRGTGMSVLEISHRSKDFEAVLAEAQDLLRELLAIPEGYQILFLQGGASLQFAMLPMNLLGPADTAAYTLTGSWSEKAMQEAEKVATVCAAASTREGGYRRVPTTAEVSPAGNPLYVHITSNETIQGIQWRPLPAFAGVPGVADMSSDFLSRPVNVADYAAIYAGLQKNAGPAGATIVILREDLLDRTPKSLPTMLRYDVMAKNNSLYNTPPVFSIYMNLLVLRWLKEMGGLSAVAERNEAKAAIIYDTIDQSEGFYRGHAEAGSRSRMNVTFSLPSEEQEKDFLARAKAEGFVGLAGHRSVGGVRASIYNACPLESCEALAAFMREYRQRA